MKNGSKNVSSSNRVGMVSVIGTQSISAQFSQDYIDGFVDSCRLNESGARYSARNFDLFNVIVGKYTDAVYALNPMREQVEYSAGFDLGATYLGYGSEQKGGDLKRQT